jgi:hypothetical protein
LGGVEIVDDDRDVPEPGRLGLTGGRLSLRLEQRTLAQTSKQDLASGEVALPLTTLRLDVSQSA